jgi:DDE superfamily endonuclease
MLIFFLSPPFYTQYVHLPPVGIPTPTIILNNPKFYPFFKDALGAMDETHINCSASAEMHQAACDQKGGVTQNCLATCGYDMIFYYIFSRWNGSAADSTMFYDACMMDLYIPADKYYLANAGFSLCDALIIPKRGVWYHLAEWGRAQQRCGLFYSVSL